MNEYFVLFILDVHEFLIESIIDDHHFRWKGSPRNQKENLHSKMLTTQ